MLTLIGCLHCFYYLTFLGSVQSISPALILTPLIKQNQIAKAKNASLVNPSHFFNLTSYSGYLTVNEEHNSNLFFWYFPATQPLEDKAWIVWLQGGPGASSLDGLLLEMGPFQYDKGLKLREHTWTKEYSMLFIDSPVGAGFSFTDSPGGLVKDLNSCSEQLYSALQQFLEMFPELRSTPLFLAGESYAGRYVPLLATKILKSEPYTNETRINLEELQQVFKLDQSFYHGLLDTCSALYRYLVDVPLLAMKILKNEPCTNETRINLNGLIMGNPIMNREATANYSAIFYHWGLIDTQGVLAVKPLQDRYMEAIDKENGTAASELRDQLLNRLDDITVQDNYYNVLEKSDLNTVAVENFFNNETVKEAIHAGGIKFTFSNYSVHKALHNVFLENVEPKMETLLEHYRVLIYCGQLDLSVACVPSAEWRRSWQWGGRAMFLSAPRLPWIVTDGDDAIAGYVKSGGRLTEVLVRGAGHLVPMDRPKEAHTLVSYFIRDLQLLNPPNYRPNPKDTPNIPADPPGQNTSTNVTMNPGLIASICVNILLVLALILGVLYFLRWKRRGENLLYAAFVDDISDNVRSLSLS